MRRGHALADLYLAIEPRLYAELEEAGLLSDARATARREWACFALYACVRGLIAAGGFNRETATAVESLHERVLAASDEGADAARRALLSERYAEYGTIGQTGGASAAATVGRRLGEAAARHMAADGTAHEALAEMAGSLHESLAEGAAESVRQAE
ncbi:MAG TPA: hypothetical protein VJY35_11115 [Candidatus Eisenbacteria bacterium]|nr:hypothetical protein [Candidatus Eisenbacteria bacterium]